MYPVSNTFKDYIKQDTVSYSWHGIVTDKDGNEYEITKENIVKSSGKITRRCSTDKLSIGTTCAAELQMNLYLDVSRYILFGSIIELYFTLEEGEDTEDVPMGIFTITESTQSNGQLSILGYDAMTKFSDTHFSPSLNNTIQSPYEWLEQLCNACSVELGMSESQIKGLPNGDRKTGFADVVTDVNSWRDVLGYLSAYLGSFAYIGRDGKLYLKKYSSYINDTIPSSFRYGSNLSDFRTTYDGLYATYKEEGLQEYVSNENSNGIIYDLGVNPFLQFTDSANRRNALQEIIDAWNGIYYVPFEADMPMVPYYDPGDVLKFIDNQAGEYDIGAITEIVYNMGGKMSITCTGDNPILAEAQDRFTKSVAGLSSDYNNGQETGGKNFWLLHTENDANITVGNAKTLVAQIDWNQKVDVQRMGFMFTCEAYITKTAITKIWITVDDSEDYEFEITEDKLQNGRRILNSTCGFRVTDKGNHSAKVYLKVTNSPTKWSEMG